ncbi:unnamed protein product, partial [Ixodes hexagonus]
VHFQIELSEHYEVENDLEQHKGQVRSRISTIDEDRNHGVEKYYHELRELQKRQVSLPPQVLSHRRSHEGQKVVSVHDDVNETVQQNCEHSLTVGPVRDAKPAAEDDQHMMRHV